MICQHDPLIPNTTMQIQSNGQASRIICLECLRAAFITKRGMFIDADPPEHAIPAPETVPAPEALCVHDIYSRSTTMLSKTQDGIVYRCQHCPFEAIA